MMHFSQNYRDEAINTLTTDFFDVLIIGGGIIGAGIASQAAASGMRTALIEKNDFAAGSSSRTSKVIHGGLRYLLNGDIEIVSDLVDERATVKQIAPHIPLEDPIIVPLFNEEAASFTPFRLKTAMSLYDTLAGLQNTQFANQILTKADMTYLLPQLKDDNLIGGGMFFDYNNDDTRLVIETIKQAHEDGAVIANHAEVIGFVYDSDNIVNGARIYDRITQKEFYINTRTIVNATGAWSDSLRKYDQFDDTPEQISPTKGIHLVVNHQKLPISRPLYIDSGENDGRMIFFIPRGETTYFGTTDSKYVGKAEDVRIEEADVAYLLRVVNRRFKGAHLTTNDIISSWVGLRPLLKQNDASDYNGSDAGRLSDEQFSVLEQTFADYRDQNISRTAVEKVLQQMHTNTVERKDIHSISRGSHLSMSASHLYTIAGGKLTDYRKIAEGSLQVINQELAQRFGRKFSLINSKNYAISGGHFPADQFSQLLKKYGQLAEEKGLSSQQSQSLARRYGSNMPLVLSMVSLAKPYANYHGYPLDLATALLYSLEYEGTYSLIDFFLRRTDYFHFHRKDMLLYAEGVASTISDYLDLCPAESKRQKEAFAHALSESSLVDLNK